MMEMKDGMEVAGNGDSGEHVALQVAVRHSKPREEPS
jgi:hypothetical protein